MPVQLSKGEKLIRDWNYASDDTSAGRKEDRIIVTDKRLIATSTSPDSVNRTEILLSSIKSISSSYSSKKTSQTQSNGGMVAIGIILLILGCVMMGLSAIQGPVMFVLGIILVIIAIVVLVRSNKGKTVLTSASFSLVIKTHGQEGTPITIGKSAGNNDSQTVVITSVIFNEKIIMDIIDTIGAVALNRVPPLYSEPSTDLSTPLDNAKIDVPAEQKLES
ncbi:MAG: hypothetical protein ACI4VK_03785 [Candidatus Coproplasma sp.]